MGLWLAHEHPESIYAYVGVAQFVSFQQNEKVAYQDVSQQARKVDNEQALKDIEGIAPYPSSVADFRRGAVARYWEEKLLGPPQSAASFTNVRRLLTDVVSTPEYSLVDDFGFVRGMNFSLNTMLPQVAKVEPD